MEVSTESNLLAGLSGITTWGGYQNKVSWIYSYQGAQAQAIKFFEETRILTASIVQDDPDDLNSRPYLEWMLGEEELAHVCESRASGDIFNSLHNLFYDLILFTNGPAETLPNDPKSLDQNIRKL